MRSPLIALLSPLIFAFAFSAHARWMTKAESSTVIENYNIEYDVNKDGSSTQLIDYTVRVQTEDGKTSASVFPIDYNSATDEVKILEAYTETEGKKFPVEAGAIEDRDKGESKDYDAMKTKTVVFPKVQIGSRLRIRYTLTTKKPMMEGRWSTEVTLGPGQFVENFTVKMKSALPLSYSLSDPRGLLHVKQKGKYLLEVNNSKTIPGWVQGEKDPYFHPGGFTNLMVSTDKSWASFFHPLLGEYDGILSAPLPPELHRWVLAAEKEKDQKARILFVMEHLSREFRYFGDWRRIKGGVIPRTLKEIDQSHYGDCKDLASVLTAMLRAMKIEADVALVRRGDNPWGEEPDYKQPDVNRFNHAIVRAKADGKTVWLDATNPVASLEPFPDIAGRPAWIMNSQHPEFDRVPQAVSRNYVHQHDYEYRFRSGDSVSVVVNAHLSHMAPYHLENQLLMASRSDVLTDTLEYFSEGQEVHSFHYLKEPKTSRNLKDLNLELEYEAGRVTYDAGKASFFVIPDGFLGGPFYETDGRESDLRLADEPFEFHGIRRLKNTKLVQSLPDPCVIHSRWMDLKRKIEVEGQDIVIYQDVDLRQPYVTRAEYRTPEFLRLQTAAKGCFYRSGILIEPIKAPLRAKAAL